MNPHARRGAAIALAILLGAGAAIALLSALRDAPATSVDPIKIEVDETRKPKERGARGDPKRPPNREQIPSNDGDPGGGADEAPPAPPPPAGDGDDGDDDNDDDDDGDD